jgi:hypothetical protein
MMTTVTALRKLHIRSLSPFTSRNFGYNNTANFSYRDVIVIDHGFRLKDWLGSPNQSYPTRHPKHGHVLSRYADCDYHRPFNYNNIGEFSLSIAAGEPIVNSNINGDENNEAVDGGDAHHDLLVCPDNLVLSGLTVDDVKVLYPYLLSEKPLEATVLAEKLNNKVIIRPFSANKVFVVVNVSSPYPLFRARQVLQWFQDSVSKKALSNSVELLLAVGMTEHRKAAQVMVLPFDDSYEGILSARQVDAIVDKFPPR